MPKHPLIEKKTTLKSGANKRHSIHNGHGANSSQRPQRGLHSKINRLLSFEDLNTNIALGVIAMGLAGVATFLLLKPKKQTRNLRKDIYKTYRDFKEDAEEFAHDAYEKGKQAYDYATDYVESLKDTAHDVIEHPRSRSLLVAGTIGGTILGASLVYLLNRNNSKEHSETLFDKARYIVDSIKNVTNSASENLNSTNWLETAKEIIEAVSERVNAHEEDDEKLASNKHSLNLQNAIELGINGFRLWQNMKRRKR